MSFWSSQGVWKETHGTLALYACGLPTGPSPKQQNKNGCSIRAYREGSKIRIQYDVAWKYQTAASRVSSWAFTQQLCCSSHLTAGSCLFLLPLLTSWHDPDHSAATPDGFHAYLWSFDNQNFGLTLDSSILPRPAKHHAWKPSSRIILLNGERRVAGWTKPLPLTLFVSWFSHLVPSTLVGLTRFWFVNTWVQISAFSPCILPNQCSVLFLSCSCHNFK